MVHQRPIYIALFVAAAAGCGPGGGLQTMPPTTSTVQSDGAGTSPRSTVREESTRRFATPEPLATGLVDPTALALHGHDVIIGDGSVVVSVRRTGGPEHVVLTNTSIYDSGSYRGVNTIAFSGADLLVGFGGYNDYHIVQAPIATGVQTLLEQIQGGFLIGVIGPNVYYGHGFCCIDRLPLAGGSPQTVLTGVWSRSAATDASAIYFVDYWTKNLMKYDVASASLTTLIGANSVEGKLALARSNVYFSRGATIQRVAKQGGPSATIFTGTEPQVLAADADDDVVFFADGHDLKAVPGAGGPARTIVSGVNVAVATADKHHLYFSDNSHGSGAAVVYRIRIGP